MPAPYLLINGGIRIFKKGESELMGFAYTDELPDNSGEMQPGRRRKLPGDYDVNPWIDGPKNVAEWEAMVRKTPPSGLWGVSPALNGIWSSGAFYIKAQSTVVHYQNGMDTSTLD